MASDDRNAQIEQQISEIQPWLLRLEHLLDAKDPRVVCAVRHIIAETAHILDAVGCGWDPVLGFAVLAFCGEKAAARSETWDAYTQDVAPIVNRRILLD